MAKVKSSAITDLNYDETTKTLQVTFTSGKSYRYDGVEPEQFAYVTGAESIGRAWNNLVKNEGWTGTPITEDA